MAASKEKQQIIALSVVLAIIVGVIAYFYRDKLLPAPTGGTALPPPSVRVQVPAAEGFKTLFDRADYKSLKQFGNVPVRAMGGGNDDPFEPEAPVAEE